MALGHEPYAERTVVPSMVEARGTTKDDQVGHLRGPLIGGTAMTIRRRGKNHGLDRPSFVVVVSCLPPTPGQRRCGSGLITTKDLHRPNAREGPLGPARSPLHRLDGNRSTKYPSPHRPASPPRRHYSSVPRTIPLHRHPPERDAEGKRRPELNRTPPPFLDRGDQVRATVSRHGEDGCCRCGCKTIA